MPAVGGDPRHHLVGMIHTLATVVPEREARASAISSGVAGRGLMSLAWQDDMGQVSAARHGRLRPLLSRLV